MSDTIQDAKRLLDGATPAPWYPHEDDWEDNLVVNDSGKDMGWGDQLRVAVEAGDLKSDRDLIAAAPELAQALAEESYEYSFQILRGDKWRTVRNSESLKEDWWAKKDFAEEIMSIAQKGGGTCRLVRRRVSPLEIVE